MIYIENKQNKITFDEQFEKILLDVIDYSLRNEGVTIQYQVSVILVNNNEIKEINKDMRRIDKVTDVLSFPMLEYPKGKVYKDVYLNKKFSEEYLDDGALVIGDIALSVEKALEQSEEYAHSFIRECAYLTVHSILHLLGYDHMEEEEKNIMRKREEEILNNFKIDRQ